MGVYKLTKRGIIGEFYATLQQDNGRGWVDPISMLMESDQEAETYAWLGMSPQMREWVGERQAKGLGEFSYSITNKEFEATLEILRSEVRRDKSGQVMTRVRELARRANSHWAKLLTDVIEAGEDTVCYDGQFFFDDDHEEGDSGSQSNDITTDISALPTQVHGSTTQPSGEEMALAILASIEQLMGLKDDQGEPLNEMENSFAVMVPTGLSSATWSAVRNQAFGNGATNPLQSSDFNIMPVVNPRLSWTDKFATFATGGEVKPLIRQEEVPVDFDGEDLTFRKNKYLYGTYASRNVGYGFWQKAVLNQLT
jgi:phage major head subunit gpT-like protein